MSSSSGELVTVNDVLEVYEPEMIRWIFASYKTNIDFAVSFDLDVIKTYEDFDRQERQAYGLEPGNDKKLAMARRVYELSQIAQTPATMPFQPSFRHLTNILQINGGDLTKARSFYSEEIKNERDERRFRERSLCALNWLNMYAPDDFKFSLNQSAPAMELSPVENNFLKSLVTTLEQSWSSNLSDKELHELIYSVINAQTDLEANGVFTMLYRALISKEKGPKLAGFLQIVGKEKTLLLLKGLL
jgi:lysyl-tRNA synthetase class 1